MDLKKLTLGTAAAILTSGLIGGAAFAALAPSAPVGNVSSITDPATPATTSDEARKPHGLEAVLDKLVANNTITSEQEAKILAAAKEAAGAKARPDHHAAKGVLGDLLKTASTYLGLEPKALATQLHGGKSLGEIAATSGKSRDGLVQALTGAASAKIDAALTAKTITADQAAKLKSGLAAHIGRFVDHKAGPRPEHPKKP